MQFKAAAGNSAEQLQYYALDQLPSQGLRFYYRLKSVDKDDSFEYSSIKTILRRTAGSRFSFYPNPAQELIQLDFRVEQNNSKVEIVLVDQLGRLNNHVIFSEALNAGDYQQSFPLNDFASGQYILQIKMDKYIEQLPLQIIK